MIHFYGICIALFGYTSAAATTAPTADDQALMTQEDTALRLVLTASDPKDRTLHFSITQPPRYGALSGTPPALTYTPAPGFIGEDSFRFIADNGQTPSDAATISLAVAPNPATLADKPAPVFITFGYATTTTAARIEWQPSSDRQTPEEHLRYEVHLSANEDFFPSADSLVTSLVGASAAQLSDLPPGETLFAKVIAVDADNHRSLEVKPLPITLPEQALEVREDIGLFLADAHLSAPELSADAQTIRFQRISDQLPAKGDYMLFNTSLDTAVFRIKDIVTLTSEQVELAVYAADIGDIMQAGDITMTLASSDGTDAGFRWDFEDGTLDVMDWADDYAFDCADAYGRNTAIDFLNAPPVGIVKYEAGAVLGCHATVEIKNRYALNSINPGMVCTDIDPLVIKEGSVRVKATVSLNPSMHIGYRLPLTLARKTIWQKQTPIERRITRVIRVGRVVVPVVLAIQIRPKIDWSLKIAAGEQVEVVTNTLMEGHFDSTIAYKRAFYADLPCIPELAGYHFEHTENATPKLSFKQTGLIGKATAATDFELSNNFLFGIGINLKNLERVAVTAGLHIALVNKGQVRDREEAILLQAPIEATPLEVRSLEVTAEPSLQALASVKLLDIDLPWWAKPADLLYTLRAELATIPLADIPLMTTPHMTLDYADTGTNAFVLNGQIREDSGVSQGLIEDKLKWHKLRYETQFTLNPTVKDGLPSADGHWLQQPKQLATAVSYLPTLVAPLLDKHPEYEGILTKYALYHKIACSPIIQDRYAIVSTTDEEDDCAVVRDLETGLEWQRCAAGQTWNNEAGACEGKAWLRYRPGHWVTQPPHNVWSFLDAVPEGWRMPTIAELRTLIYCSSGSPVVIGMTLDDTPCGSGSKRPTIVEEAFPSTPVWGFASATPAAADDFWWLARFDSGNVNGGAYNLTYNMRYVRDAP
ncbi:MAG: DUF1566 domain-containing protein [Cellvibrionaceae bacterium]|nr:DUF1566 domain-containing protein [Cellvibrionaceae bacterium]